MQAFSGVADELLVDRIMQHLRAEYADTVVQLPSRMLMLSEITEADLKAMVHTGLARARGYGLSHESTLAGFIAIMFEAAPNFDSYPLMQQILQDESAPPNARLDLLLDQATEEDWASLKESYDSSAWKVAAKE